MDGLPSEYDVQFFGELASLKDTLSETKLRDLNGLSKYSFPFNYTNVRKGFESGFDVVIADGAGLREETSISINQVPTVTGEATVTVDNPHGLLEDDTVQLNGILLVVLELLLHL